MTVTYRRVGKQNAYLFVPDSTGDLDLTVTPGGASSGYPTYEFDQVATTPPPPPPPGGFFLPVPSRWKSALKADFTAPGVTLSSLGDWDYSGAPGGTSGCQWESSQVTFVEGEGALLTTQFSAALDAWISGGFGTTAAYSFPIRVRWYEIARDANVDGKNRVRLLWKSPWIEECDGDECGVSNGAWTESIFRVHNGSSANVITPIVGLAPVVGVMRCTEIELAPVAGVPTATLRIDGTVVGTPSVIPAADWATMLANPHWVGIQDELYSIGTAPKSAVSVSQILGCEVFTPA